MLRQRDSNPRPLGNEPNELPTAPHRDFWHKIGNFRATTQKECKVLTHFFHTCQIITNFAPY